MLGAGNLMTQRMGFPEDGTRDRQSAITCAFASTRATASIISRKRAGSATWSNLSPASQPFLSRCSQLSPPANTSFRERPERSVLGSPYRTRSPVNDPAEREAH